MENENKEKTVLDKEVKEINSISDEKQSVDKQSLKEETKISNDEDSKLEVEDTSSDELVSETKLLECGVQYGHESKRWNPAMKPFIKKIKLLGIRKKRVHIINVVKTRESILNTYAAITKITERGGTILFIGTNVKYKTSIEENAIRAGSFYVNHRWLGGTLTNFKTIQNSITRLRNLERISKNNFKGYTKKEGLELQRELEKLQKNLGGIKYMRRKPTALFVASVHEEKTAIKEAKKLGIPVFGIVDTNEDPYFIRFPIFANDDSNKSVSLIITLITDAITSVKNGETKAAYKKNEAVEILGLNPIKKIIPKANDLPEVDDVGSLLSRTSRSRLNRALHLKEEQRSEKDIAKDIAISEEQAIEPKKDLIDGEQQTNPND